MPAIRSKTRRIIHPTLEIEHAYGDKAVTCDRAKEILGWLEEPEDGKWGDDYWIKDLQGKKIRSTNNHDPKAGVYNRPIDLVWVGQLDQDILNREWAGPTTMPGETVNGETIRIGRTGRVLSAQHSLVAVVFAYQRWKGLSRGSDQSRYWQDKWPVETYPNGPVIDCLIVTGVSEADTVVRTIDCVRPRTVSDTLYVDGYFPKATPKDREQLCKVMDSAVRLLWERTAADENAFSPHRTNAHVVDFLDRHPKLKRMVEHVFLQNSSKTRSKAVQQYVPSLGYAAALAYLMAASDTDSDRYDSAHDSPSERRIDFGQWDKAQEYWTLLAEGHMKIRSVALARRPTSTGEYNGHYFARTNEAGESVSGGTFMERVGVLLKGWNCFKQGFEMGADDVALKYDKDEDGDMILEDFPTVGGIDQGSRKGRSAEKESSDVDASTDDPETEVVLETEALPPVEDVTPPVETTIPEVATEPVTRRTRLKGS